MSEIHAFKVEYAVEYKSMEIATLIAHFSHWISINSRKGTNFEEDRTWTYQTMKDIQAVYPYWSEDQIQRLLKKMESLKILRKGNFNKAKYDRTLWYSFENEEKFSIPRNCGMDSAEVNNGKCEIAEPIPDTKPVTSPVTQPTTTPTPSKGRKGRSVGSSVEEKEEMRKRLLEMKMKEKNCPHPETFSVDEVDALLSGFSCETINNAAVYLQGKKCNSQKGYFLNAIYKGYKK